MLLAARGEEGTWGLNYSYRLWLHLSLIAPASPHPLLTCPFNSEPCHSKSASVSLSTDAQSQILPTGFLCCAAGRCAAASPVLLVLEG